jgi:hypothetical protein
MEVLVLKRKTTAALTVIVIALSLCGFGCPHGTQNLATASDAIAHSLVNAQAAARQAEMQGVISKEDEQQFEMFVVKVAQAGLALDKGIRANESATTLSTKVNSFLDAFNQLNTTGLLFVKDPNLRVTISTIITGAETSVAIIAATVGK